MPHAVPLALFAARVVTPPTLPPRKTVLLSSDAAFAFGIVLVALDDHRVPLLGQQLLDAQVALPTSARAGRLVAELELPVGFDVALYWQLLGIDPVGSLVAGDVRRYDAAGDDVPLILDYALEEPPDLGRRLPPARRCDLPLTLATDHYDDGAVAELFASFLAPTDGYGLVVTEAGLDERSGDARVHLYRKLPGPGEGRLPLEQQLAVTARIPGRARHVCVFLAEGTTGRPQGAIAWTHVARLPR